MTSGAISVPVRTEGSVITTFLAILRRDITVTTRELPSFLAQMIIQPLFLLFVFGRVLTELGFTSQAYATQLFPGIVAMTVIITALQSVALPLVIELSFTKEIEDRLLAPLPTALVAVEKIIFSAGRGLVAGAAMFPIGLVVLGRVPFEFGGLPLLIVVSILGALAGAAMGMTLGTSVTPQRISFIFALVLTPLLFTGCSQYPWPSLDRLPWFKVVTLLNPLTYVSEGMRAALVPQVPHMVAWVTPLALLVSVAVFGWVGLRLFARRAMD